MKTATPPCAHGEPDAVTNRKSGSAGGGEENHRPKGRHGASPPTQPGSSGHGGVMVSPAWVPRNAGVTCTTTRVACQQRSGTDAALVPASQSATSCGQTDATLNGGLRAPRDCRKADS